MRCRAWGGRSCDPIVRMSERLHDKATVLLVDDQVARYGGRVKEGQDAESIHVQLRPIVNGATILRIGVLEGGRVLIVSEDRLLREDGFARRAVRMRRPSELRVESERPRLNLRHAQEDAAV